MLLGPTFRTLRFISVPVEHVLSSSWPKKGDNICCGHMEIRRGTARGHMYTPKELYRIGGPTKSNKHYLLKYRKMRGHKYIRLNLPDLDSYNAEKMREENHQEYLRTYLKRYGFDPVRPVTRQHRYFINCSDAIFDPYQPQDNDGYFSEVTSKGFVESTKSKATELFDKSKSVALRRYNKALKKIKEADAEFDVKTFGERAFEIYLDTLQALQDRDEEKLHDLVTETAFPKMWDELESKTLRWEFVKSLEAPKLVHLRSAGMDEDLTFGQATVRFHTQQKLAIFDQFGRLFMGSEDVVRDVLEYVVFENFLSNQYGIWRIHGKILSTKSAPAPAMHPTYCKRETDVTEDGHDAGGELKQKYIYKIDEKTMGGEEEKEKEGKSRKSRGIIEGLPEEPH